MSRQRDLTNLLQTRNAGGAELLVMGDVALYALLGQLVEDAVRLLEPQARNEPIEVVERRLDMIFDEVVHARSQRNVRLARLLQDRALSSPLREEIQRRVFESLRQQHDTTDAAER